MNPQQIRLNVFPIIFISSLSGKPIEYQLCEFGKGPNLYPGIELSLSDHKGNIRRWQIDRVHHKEVKGRIALFVLCTPCIEVPFANAECDHYAHNIYQELIGAIQELEAKKKGDVEDEDDDSYLWN